MSDTNDALAHQIIRSAHEEKLASRGAFQMASHPLNAGSQLTVALPSPNALVAVLVAGFRSDLARLTTHLAAQSVPENACCAAAG